MDAGILVKLSKNRKTKWGDFRVGYPIKKPTITINNSLNQKAFLLTLIHELAHYHCWKKYGKSIKPHGNEWKAMFTKLTYPALTSTVFDKPYRTAILKHLAKPKSSICYDIELMKYLEPNTDEKSMYLSQIPKGTNFYLNNKTFTLLEFKRTRALCLNLSSNKKYLVHLSNRVQAC